MADRLHPDEVPIDDALVARLLVEQQPQLSGRPLRRAATQGTDNVVYRLGDDLAVRLPRKAGAVDSLERESTWLPRLAPALPLAVPEPVALGVPAAGYPFTWSVVRWMPGRPPTAPLSVASVDQLAAFVVALEAQPTAGAPVVPPGQRGGPLAALDPAARQALTDVAELLASGRVGIELGASVDLDRAAAVWQAALDAPAWDRPGVWVHRDLMRANLLVDGGARLVGVVDFGGLAVGDPAGNLLGAFHVVDPSDHDRFRAGCGADEATWARARGLALLQALQAWPYYLDSHPGMVAMAVLVLSTTLGKDV